MKNIIKMFKIRKLEKEHEELFRKVMNHEISHDEYWKLEDENVNKIVEIKLSMRRA